MITDYLKYVNDQPYVVKRETPVHVFAKKGENKFFHSYNFSQK